MTPEELGKIHRKGELDCIRERYPHMFSKCAAWDEMPEEVRAITAAGAAAVARSLTPDRPTIVCLCGSTRFWRTFQQASLTETLAGRIVLSIGAASGTDDEHFGNLPREEYDRIKPMLDELHMRKIDLADEVLILNLGGYIGESTRRELVYAKELGKTIRYWEAPVEVERVA